MKEFIDYLCELSLSSTPKYSLVQTNSVHVTKRITGEFKRIGRTSFDTLFLLDFYSSVNEWRSFQTLQSGKNFCFIKWLFKDYGCINWRFL